MTDDRNESPLDSFSFLVRYTASFGGGAMLGLSVLFPESFWFFALIAPVPLLLAAMHAKNAKESFGKGFIFGLGCMIFVLSWGLLSYPLDWLGIPYPPFGVFIVISTWLLLSAVLALSFGVFATSIYTIRHKSKALFLFLTVSFFLCMEYLRAYIWTLLLYGNGTLLGAHFSNGFAGYALTGSSLLWFAKWGGVYTLSAIALCSSIAIVFFVNTYRTSKKTSFWLLIPLSLYAAGCFFPQAVVVTKNSSNVSIDGLHIALVRTDFPRLLMVPTEEAIYRGEVQAQEILYTLQATPAPDVIVLPEGGRFLYRSALISPSLRDRVYGGLQEKKVLLIDSGRTQIGNAVSNNVIWFSGEVGEVIHEDTKQLLSPFGEYMPYIFKYAMYSLGLSSEVAGFEKERSYISGGNTFVWEKRSFLFEGKKLGVLECSEVVSPSMYEELGEHVDILVNVSSAAWSQGSPLLSNQLLAMEKVHVVVTGKPYVQATNMGPNVVIVPR